MNGTWRGLENLDDDFDRLIPNGLRHLSSLHWTPARVAVRVAGLLRATANTCVLDVGAGVGKVCTIGALSGHGTWIGVEQHRVLVDSARTLARRLDVSHRTSFVIADAFALDWNDFDVLYFYNPFELKLFGTETSGRVAAVQRRLENLPDFTRVVTLRGFGGVMPASFELIYHELVPFTGLDLALWSQRRRRAW